MNLYDKTCFQLSEQVTRNYSTSFYSASRLFASDIRMAIFSIYGFVRYADEIVDTFHNFDKARLLKTFESDYYQAYNSGISLNPILQSFQLTVNKYSIPDKYIRAFLKSMRMDLEKKCYENHDEIREYIHGSAEVVGMMCLKVFCHGDEILFRELEEPASRLGSAFQKVNFLRDLKDDSQNLDRSYFPGMDRHSFNEMEKLRIVLDIEHDFALALQGIRKLPDNSKFAVTVAYFYYMSLLSKIKSTPAAQIISRRIRVSNLSKLHLMLKSLVITKLNLI